MKTLKIHLRTMIGLGALAVLTSASFAKQPNIIFILTDDQGYGDLGRHGHPHLDTPHTDRLYDESVRFDNFYVSPSCSPTRAALMTGMHEFRNGVTHTLEPREHLYKEATILPQLLKTAGYKTGFIGKWHLSDRPGYGPHERGFDWTASNPRGPHKHFDPEIIRNNKRTQHKGFREDIFFNEAMAFVDEAGDQPFFLYLNTYSPHTPLDAPKDLIEKYLAKGLIEKHATYLAMIENIDQNVGRLTEFLEERELEDDTILMYINDNGVTEGLDVYNAGMRGCKATIWEGGSRAMSFWKWPGKWTPHTANNLTAHLDVLPTLCDLAGVDIPAELQEELQGYSLVPLLEAKEDVKWAHDARMLYHNVGRWPSGTAAAHKYAMCGVRKGNYLLIRSLPCNDATCEEFQSQCTTLRSVRNGLKTTTYAGGTAQYHWGITKAEGWTLFDVKADPGCLKDISQMHPELVTEMIASYENWWDEQYPVMIERGGDLGDPNESRRAGRAAAKAKEVKAAARKKQSTGKTSPKADLFYSIDTDGNQLITEKEYVAHFFKSFEKKDANQDTRLSEAEFAHAAFKTADANQNGEVTTTEYKGFYANQFKRRDADKDGFVVLDEL